MSRLHCEYVCIYIHVYVNVTVHAMLYYVLSYRYCFYCTFVLLSQQWLNKDAQSIYIYIYIYIRVSKLTIIGSDNGLSPGQRQAIIWTNAEIHLMGPLGTNFSENLIGIQTFSFKKNAFEKSSATKWRLFRLGLNELTPNATFAQVFSDHSHLIPIYNTTVNKKGHKQNTEMHTETQEPSQFQLRRNRWHRKLSEWQPPVPPAMTKSPPRRQLSIFSPPALS